MNKVMKTVLKIAIPVVILVVAVIIRFNVVNSDKFSLAKYAVVNVTGVDGHGKATAAIDEIGLYAALAGSNATPDQKNKYFDFVSSVKVELDRTEQISNNEDLKVTVTYSEAEAKKVGITVDQTERSQHVTGLLAGTKVDLFADLKLITTGVSPFISITYTNESENSYISSLEYDLSQTTNLALGDTVMVTCKADANSAAAQGYFFDNDKMTFKITTADVYLKNKDEIPSEILDNLIAEDIATIEQATADKTFHMSYQVSKVQGYLYRDNNEAAINLSFHRLAIAQNVIETLMDHQNYVMIFLKGQIQMPNYNGTEDPNDYLDAYFCFLYSDAIIKTDKTFSMATNDPMERFVCGATYEDCMQAAIDRIGAGFQFNEFKED